MSLEIRQLPEYIFKTTYTTNQAVLYYGANNGVEFRKYLEIPILGPDEFEVPVLAFPKFIQAVKRDADIGKEAIVAELYSYNKELRYTTVNRYMRDVLVDYFNDNYLLKCIVKDKDVIHNYYGTHGAVFLEDFTPVMMCSWVLWRRLIEEENRTQYIYEPQYPIVRIDPSIYLNQADSMEKFIIRKFIPACLEHDVKTDINCGRFRNQVYKYPSIRIEKSPFRIRQHEEPDINTTNESLRQIVINHPEEIIQ